MHGAYVATYVETDTKNSSQPSYTVLRIPCNAGRLIWWLSLLLHYITLITLLIATSFIVELVTFMTFQKYFLRIPGPEGDKAISHLKQNFENYFYDCVQDYPSVSWGAKTEAKSG